MPKTRPLIAGALIAAAGLIGANGVAYAATGNALILGHKNSANAATTIHRTTHGPALQLEAPAGSAPLAVNRPVKVARLNADLVDGKDAAQLQTRAIRYAMPHNVASDGVSF